MLRRQQETAPVDLSQRLSKCLGGSYRFASWRSEGLLFHFQGE
jgi:hypothetical protein